MKKLWAFLFFEQLEHFLKKILVGFISECNFSIFSNFFFCVVEFIS